MELIGLLSALVIGLGVGLVSSVLGLGGGIIIVPLLPLLTQLSPRETIATSLLTVFFVTSVNSWRFHKMNLVAWDTGIILGVFAALASFAAAKATGLVPTFALHAGMAVALALVALLSLAPWVADRAQLPNKTELQRRTSSGVIGLASGLVAGFTGIGGGVLVTPLLARLKAVAATHVVPTANASIMFTSLAGAFALVKVDSVSTTSASLGLVRMDLALALFVGAQVTSPFGRRYQSRLDPRKRDWLIGILLVALTFRTLIAAWRAY